MTAIFMITPLKEELRDMRLLVTRMQWHHFIVEIVLIAAILVL